MRTLFGVGVGPGDPELVTVRAADLDPAAPGPYLSTLIVPPARTGRGHALR